MMHKVVSAVWRLAGGGVVALSIRLGAGLALLLAWLAFSAGPAASEPTCTKTWTGGAGTASWTTPENWSGGVPGSSDVACIGSATVQVGSGANHVRVVQGEGTLEISGGSLELAEESAVSTLGSLSLTGGTLSVSGTVDVTSSLTSSSDATVDGSGHLVVESGASGSLGEAGCSLLTLSGVTLVNEGTTTLGASGGVSGQLDMQEGARLENTGTFNADSYPAGCVPGSNSAAIQSNGGSPAVSNTGTFNVGPGSGHTASVSVPFNNDGTVHVLSGVLKPSGGGSSTSGTLTAASGSELSFTGGSFSLGGNTWSGAGTIAVAGATVTATSLTATEADLAVSSGSLTIPEGSTTTAASLGLTGGTLSVSGTLDVASSLTSSGEATVSGAGHLVVKSGASGSLGEAGCSLLTLSGVTFVNEGTTTLGASGGVSGQLDMHEGARLENTGTFNADSYPAGCVPGSNSASIQNNGGSPVVSNTGTFNAGAGSGHTVLVSVPLDDEGAVHVASGELNPTGGGSSTGATWTTASGTEVTFTTGSYSLAHDTASGAKLALSGGTLTIATGTTTVGSLGLTGGTLSVSGTLDVASSLVSSSDATVSGSGSVVIGSGASGSFGEAGCSLLTLSGVTLVNEGTTTLGASGGVSGQFDMQEGARLENTGTFNADSYSAGCVPGSNSAAIQNNGGSPAVSNAGTFNAGPGSGHTASVSVAFNNDGAVHGDTGTLQLSGGGIPEHVASGSWEKESGASIVLSAGTFLISEAVDLSQVEVTGATVERVPAEGPPSGSLSSLSYAAGTVEVAGSGHANGAGFASAAIEVTPLGAGEWHSLCGSLTPGLGGEFGCAWNTLSGSYADGDYQLRGRLTDSASPPASATTAAISVLVDNTAPTGSLTPPSYIGSASAVTGIADDAGSGVASWQLQITPAGHSEWADACAAQSTPSSGDDYTCTVNTSGLSEGGYELRAVITDRAGNTHTTSAGETTLDTTAPSGSLGTITEYARGTVSLGGTGSDAGSGVATWTPQIAAVGSSSWANACAPQSTPISGSTYGCSLNTTGYTDGAYQLRAVIADNAGNTHTTSVQDTTIDNTPPTGSLDALGRHSSGTVEVRGPATDALSGVAGWQLEIKPTGSGSWENACLAQTAPLESDIYGCSVDTTLLTDGSYQLRTTLTDNAGNTHATSPVSTHIDNHGEEEGGSEAGCTDVWTGLGSDDSWQTAENWSAGVPGSSDRACIPSGATAQIASGTNQVASLAGEGTLQLTGGTLEVTDNTTTSELASLEVSGGTLTGAGTVEIYGGLSWSGGVISGSGETVLTGEATSSIDPTGGSGHVRLEEHTLANYGTLTLAEGSILMSSSEIENTGTFKVNSESSGYSSQIEVWSGTNTLTNTGTVEKTAGTGATTIGIPLHSTGTINSASGHLGLPGGTSVTLGTGSILKGQLDLEGATVTTTADVNAEEASIALSGGSLNLESGRTFTVGHYTQSNGTVEGAGTLALDEAFTWTGGTMAGSGQTVIPTGLSASIEPGGGSGHVRLEDRTLVNHGTLTLAEGAILMSGAEIENTGTFKVNSESSGYSNQLENWSGTNTLLNTGTVEKTTGTGTTKLGVTLTNEGTLNAATGHFALPSPTSVTLGAGSTLKGSFALEGASVTATASVNAEEATIALSGGSLSIASSKTLTVGHYTQSDGTVEGAGTLALDEAFTWTGGTMSGSGQTVIPTGLSAAIEPGGGSGHVRLEDRTLVNHGTLTLAEGAILMSGAEIENTGTFKVNSESSGYSNQLENWSGTNTLVNTGTVEKTTGTGTTKLGVTLTNEGTLDAATGHFAFPSPTSITLAGGSTLTGSFHLEGASVTAASFNGTHASLALSSGTLSINSGATPTIASLTQTGGTLQGAGTLEISEALTWSAGTMSGSGETILAPESTSSIDPGSGSAHVILEERTLLNEGALTFPEGTLFMESGAQIHNAGYFDANSQTEWYSNQIEDWSGTVSIDNTGTFQKTTGTGTTRVGVPFNNDGSVKADTGQFCSPTAGSPATSRLAPGQQKKAPRSNSPTAPSSSAQALTSPR